MPPFSRPRRTAVAGLVASASIAALAVGGVAVAGAASAALTDVPATGTPGRLVLSSDPYPAQFLDLSPGVTRHWRVDARLEDAATATLALQLRKNGALVEHARGLRMTVDVCDSAWSTSAAPDCPTGARRVTAATPTDDYRVTSPSFELAPLRTGAPQRLLITLAIEDSVAARADDTLMGLTGDMAVGLVATAFDETPVSPPSGALAVTGPAWASVTGVAAIAAGILGLGTALRMARRGRMT